MLCRLDLRHVPLVSTQAVIKFAAKSKHNLHVQDVKLVELRKTWSPTPLTEDPDTKTWLSDILWVTFNVPFIREVIIRICERIVTRFTPAKCDGGIRKWIIFVSSVSWQIWSRLRSPVRFVSRVKQVIDTLGIVLYYYKCLNHTLV